MSNQTTFLLPDIGDSDEVEIIEVLVSAGDDIEDGDSIITLESDKASMEIPIDKSGVIKKLHVKVGDKVKNGSQILDLEETQSSDSTKVVEDSKKDPVPIVKQNIVEEIKETPAIPVSNIEDIVVPDIGDFDEVEVIEVLVNVGDSINKEDSLITLESDKASMEIPSATTGIIETLNVKVGDKIKQGSIIGSIKSSVTPSLATSTTPVVNAQTSSVAPTLAKEPKIQQPQPNDSSIRAHASPSIRKLARELGVDLNQVKGTGPKNRVLETELKAFVKNIMQNPQQDTGGLLPSTPKIDFSQFGEIEKQPLSRINKLSGAHLTACWLNIPHVTQFDEVNISEMESFRIEQKAKGVKLTPLVFIMKALVHTMLKFPRFNSSLAGDNLIIKKYYNIGVAVNTPNGLIVPIIRNVDQKSLLELAGELTAVSLQARDGKLTKKDLSGGCITVSSLGGIGGTQFTPIVNAPEVAILGVSRSQTKPIWNGESFIPELMLPLALSYDHRVIDGAQGAEFITALKDTLSDIREILL